MNLDLPLFGEVAVLIAFAAAIGAIGTLLRQPLVVSFIVAGLLAGPDVLGLVRSSEPIMLLADIGVALLLLLVGLRLDVRTIRTLGAVATVTGLGQVIFTSALGFLICIALGLAVMDSAYVAIALTFSSTIIVVKLLTDQREIDSLHGRIALGFLIVQDLVVVLAMVVLSAMGMAGGPGAVSPLDIAIRGVVIVLLALAVVRPMADRLLSRLGRSPELLGTVAIAWTVLLSAAGDWAGFGKELGGLLAGVSLASTGARHVIASRLSGLRDFLLLFFFVALGGTLDLGVIATQIPAVVALSAFVLIGNPLIVMLLMGLLGYRSRTGLLAGLTVAQISEFSLIFVAMGADLGHVGSDAVGVVTMVGLVTIAGSTYMILYSHRLYDALEPMLRIFEPARPRREEAAAREHAIPDCDVLLFGLGRYGSRLGHKLHERGLAVLGVDLDPDAVRDWRAHGHEAIYGDASDPELLQRLPTDAPIVVIALPRIRTGVVHVDARAALVRTLRASRGNAPIAVATDDGHDGEVMRHDGATFVLQVYDDAADLAAERVIGAMGERTRRDEGRAAHERPDLVPRATS